ncbi:MAG: hypothetical protein JWO06_3594 [Bacteroidota bacterium]|nr:hypothetical protein [Bacteroidota bacterium]
MKTPKISFNLEANKNKDGTSLIFLNMSYGYSDYDPLTGKKKYKYLRISTQQRIKAKFWEKDRPSKDFINKNGSTIVNEINYLKTLCETQLSIYYSQNNELPRPEVLKEIIEVKLERRQPESTDSRIVSYIEKYIQVNAELTVTTKGKIGEGQVKKYVTIKNQLMDFEAQLNQPLSFLNFDNAKFLEWLDYANEQYKIKSENPYGYLNNTIAKNADTLRAILYKAKKDKIDMLIDMDDEKLIINDVDAKDADVYISEKNLKKIIGADTLQSKEFINAKRYFIICAFTSLRYEDMENLHKVTIEKYKVKKHSYRGFITLLRKNSKPNKPVEVCIPILKPVQDILDQNGGLFPEFPSNQKMNEQLKKFAKHIGLNESFEIENWYYKHDKPIKENKPLHQLVKCHIGRGSFITNLGKSGINKVYVDYVTHPNKVAGTSDKYYNKMALVDRANLLVQNIIENGKSDLYCF